MFSAALCRLSSEAHARHAREISSIFGTTEDAKTGRANGRGHRRARRHRLAKCDSSPKLGPSLMAESTETLSLKEIQLHDKDTGSADVQVALLTRRIEHLTEHLKSNAKDHSSRRGLLKMVAQRRSLLDYLSKTKSDRYKNLIDKLSLRK